MNCADVGSLRAYVDGEVDVAERTRLREHLGGCASCRQRMDELTDGSLQVWQKLDVLAPRSTEVNPPVFALRAFRERNPSRGNVWQWLQGGLSTMENSSFGRGWRLASASLAAVVLALALVMTPVGSAVGEWLSVFRAEKFAPISIDPKATRTANADLNPNDFGTFTVRSEPQVEELADARAAQVDFAVRQPTYLPAGIGADVETRVSTPGEVVFQFDREKSQAALAEMGVVGQLPESVDGSIARVYVPAGVQQAFLGPDGEESGLAFIQMRSPTLELPQWLDNPATRQVFYSLAGLDPQLVSQLETFVEKGDTAPVPVLAGDTSKPVQVDGAEGLLVTHRPEMVGSDAPEGTYVVWQKGGVVYALGGTVDEAELLKVANSLQ